MKYLKKIYNSLINIIFEDKNKTYITKTFINYDEALYIISSKDNIYIKEYYTTLIIHENKYAWFINITKIILESKEIPINKNYIIYAKEKEVLETSENISSFTLVNDNELYNFLKNVKH